MSAVRLFAGTRKGLFTLEADADRGEWTVGDPGLSGWEVQDVCADSRGHTQLYAAVGHFVYGPTIHRSIDGGSSWEQVERSPAYPDDPDRPLNRVWTIVPGRDDDPGTLYAGVDEAGLFVSHDRGANWDAIEGLANHETRLHWQPGAGGLCLHSILPHPHDPDRLWVGISPSACSGRTTGGTRGRPSTATFPGSTA